MKNRSWKREKSRQDSQESTASTQTSSSIREFELFQQFCSNNSPTWEVPSEVNEITYSWDTSLHEAYPGLIADGPSSLAASESKGETDGPENRAVENGERSDVDQRAERSSLDFVGSQQCHRVSLDRQKSNSRSVVTCRVLLLDNLEYVVEVCKKSNGQTLFDAVCQHINLLEKDYFCCSYRDKDDNKVWLNMEKKLCRQVNGGPFQFAFEVRFYPTDFAYLQEDITRYQLCLQVQRDICSGRLPCSFITYALLGSYLVQSELGDHTMEEMGFGASYVRHLQFAPNQTEELLEKVAELHRTHRGLCPAESDLLYLLNASKLAMYGVELHEAKDVDGECVMFGICSSGLMTYRGRLRISKFIWPRILRISYKGRHFHILVRPNENDDIDSNISYKFPTQRIAKRVWRTVVEYHTFYRLKESDPVGRGFFPRFGSSRFQYLGRTQHQSREVSSQIDRPAPTFDRALSRSFNASNPTGAQSCSKNVAVIIETANNKQNFLTDGEIVNRTEVNDCHRESPTVSCSSRLTSAYSHHLPTTPSQCSSRSEGQLVKSQVRTVTYAAPGTTGSAVEDFGILVSAHSHSSRTHTIETTTYQTERDGVLETRVEKKFLLSSDNEDVDQNTVFADVIRSVADVDPDLSVEKIEIHTRSELDGN